MFWFIIQLKQPSKNWLFGKTKYAVCIINDRHLERILWRSWFSIHGPEKKPSEATELAGEQLGCPAGTGCNWSISPL